MPIESNASPITTEKPAQEKPQILEEIVIEELSIDGTCGVYSRITKKQDSRTKP